MEPLLNADAESLLESNVPEGHAKFPQEGMASDVGHLGEVE